jgi:outer membrane lipoprotein-sorting protein
MVRDVMRQIVSGAWRISLLSALGFVLCVAEPGRAGAQESGDAGEIIERALEQNSLEFESGRAEMKLNIEDRDGDRSERKMVLESKALGGGARTRIELTGPEELKGQAFLFVENEGGSDDVWMYVPAFEVTRRVEGSKKQGSFLGSHFTYNDLESRDIADADYEKIADESIGDDPVHVIRAEPNESAESEYGRIVAYIRKSDDAPLKFKFYDDSDELLKTLFTEKLGETEDGGTYVKQMQMRSEKGGYTRIVIESLESGADTPDSAFTRDQLGK